MREKGGDKRKFRKRKAVKRRRTKGYIRKKKA